MMLRCTHCGGELEDIDQRVGELHAYIASLRRELRDATHIFRAAVKAAGGEIRLSRAALIDAAPGITMYEDLSTDERVYRHTGAYSIADNQVFPR